MHIKGLQVTRMICNLNRMDHWNLYAHSLWSTCFSIVLYPTWCNNILLLLLFNNKDVIHTHHQSVANVFINAVQKTSESTMAYFLLSFSRLLDSIYEDVCNTLMVCVWITSMLLFDKSSRILLHTVASDRIKHDGKISVP